MRIRLLPSDLPLAWWLPYSWLVYLSFLAFYAFHAHHSAGWLAVHVVAVVVFLVLYFRGYWLDGRQLLPIIAGITAIGAALIPWNPGASVFFVYASGFVGDVGRPAVAVRWLLAILAVVAVETLVLHLRAEAWVPAALLPLLIGGGNIGFAEKRRADGLLRMARDEVEHLAKVAERERIARDLHDLLGHTLSVIVLKSELAAKLTDIDAARAGAEIRDVERISREALAEVRRAVQGYRDLTLADSLARAREALLAGGVAVEAETDRVEIDAVGEGILSFVLREAVTNVVRHAKASRCRITLKAADGRVQLVVADDGIGGNAAPGAGMTGMRSRVEELGGRFEHDGREGTRVTVDLPLAADSGRPR